MRSKFIAGLLVLGSVLALVTSALLIYRSLYFASYSGDFISAFVGVLIGAISLFFTFKMLGEAGRCAENRITKIDFRTPLRMVFLSFIGSLVAIHFAGLSVGGYLQWLASGLQVPNT